MAQTVAQNNVTISPLGVLAVAPFVPKAQPKYSVNADLVHIIGGRAEENRNFARVLQAARMTPNRSSRKSHLHWQWSLPLALACAGCGGGGAETTAFSPSSPVADAGQPDAAGWVRAATQCSLRFMLANTAQGSGPDPLLAQQWHLLNTGQSGGAAGEDLRATLAWPTTRGNGVRVAITDDGIDLTHADLEPNLAAGASHNYLGQDSIWPVPCSTSDDHGTAVAGVLLARSDNALGGAGVAPLAKFAAYNALSANDDASLADAMTRGPENQIWHNSWGSPDDGRPNAAPAVWDSAIDDGLLNARAGRGAIFIFPGGNGGAIDVKDTGGQIAATIAENSNLDGYANKRGVITACAVSDTGVAPIFAERGANLLVCAPGRGRFTNIVTTMISASTPPYDQYRSDFGGTSASAPMVSGVTALMLAVNPTLSWRDVQRILAKSARPTDLTDPGWVNAFGIRFNHRYGFGVVNAQEAVRLAKGWTTVGTSREQKVCGPYARFPNQPIGDSPGFGSSGPIVSDTMETPGCNIVEVEFVEVRFTSEHPYAADLRIRLQSPNGLISELADERACGKNVPSANNPCLAKYQDWRFGSIRHLGEPLAGLQSGPWTLQVSDRGPGDTGNLQRWSLTLYGR